MMSIPLRFSILNRFLVLTHPVHAAAGRDRAATNLDDALLSANANDALKDTVHQFDEACTALAPFFSTADGTEDVDLPTDVRTGIDALNAALQSTAPVVTTVEDGTPPRRSSRLHRHSTAKAKADDPNAPHSEHVSHGSAGGAGVTRAIVSGRVGVTERPKDMEKQRTAKATNASNECAAPAAPAVPDRLAGKKRKTKGRKSSFTHKKSSRKKARSDVTPVYALMHAKNAPAGTLKRCFICKTDVNDSDDDVARVTACCDHFVHLACATTNKQTVTELQKDGKCKQCSVNLQTLGEISLRGVTRPVFDVFAPTMFWGVTDQTELGRKYQNSLHVARDRSESFETHSEPLWFWNGEATETCDTLLASLGEECQRLHCNKKTRFAVRMKIAAFLYRFVRTMGLLGKCGHHKPGAHANVKCECRKQLEDMHDISDRDFSRYEHVGDLVHSHPIFQFTLPHDDLVISWREFADAADAICEACTWMSDKKTRFYDSVLELEEELDNAGDGDGGSNGGSGGGGAATDGCSGRGPLHDDAQSSASTAQREESK